jgi:hypothetical protein
LEPASWCAAALLWALVPAAAPAQPQAGEGAAASPLRIEQVRVSPERPGTETLCQLGIRLRNGGEKPMYAFAVDVKLDGTPLPIYERQLFLQALPAGEAAELRLFNFWTTETGRPRPADGRLVVEVTVREALWLDITEETPAEETEGAEPPEPVEVWTPAGAVPGLPVRAAVTLELRS